jgi:hypothetical protein
MQENWVYIYQDILKDWEVYGVYDTAQQAQSTLKQLKKWGKQAKIKTTYDF